MYDEYVVICVATNKYIKEPYHTWDDQTKKLSQAIIFDSEEQAREYMLFHFMIEPAYRLVKLD